MKKDVAVVVPIYKENMDRFEKIALGQLRRVLGKYDTFFITPNRLLVDDLRRNEKAIGFEDAYFESIESYNNLMTDESFYKVFDQYKYILMYQLDAFVFADTLLSFISLGYDYIGAAWEDGFPNIFYAHEKIYVGNGGLSLRKVDACINAIRSNKDRKRVFDYKNEDLFFASCKDLKVAPYNVALSFSWEKHARDCYRENGNKLPFGCHAWFKYDFDFWRPHLEKFDYSFDDCAIEVGYDTKGYIEEIDVLKNRLAKKNRFYNILVTWMSNIQNGIRCSAYMRNHGYSNVAIYGMKEVGTLLFNELTEDGISVKYVVDKAVDKLSVESTLLRPEEMTDNVNAVIVTVALGYEEVRDNISQYVSCPILNIYDILREAQA